MSGNERLDRHDDYSPSRINCDIRPVSQAGTPSPRSPKKGNHSIMSKEYGYPRLIARWHNIPVLIVSLFALLFGTLYSLKPLDAIESLPHITMLLLVALVLLIPSCYLCYRYGSTRLVVTRDELVHTNREGVSRYPLDAVYVLGPSKKIAGAFRSLPLKAGDDVVEVGWGLQDMPGFITELKEALDAKNLSHHYDCRKLLTYVSRLVNAKDEERWVLPVCGTYGLLLCNTCAASVVGFACGASAWGSTDFGTCVRYFFFWFVFSAVFWLVITFITAFTCKYCVAKRKIDEGSFAIGPPDTVSEKRIMRLCVILASVTYMIISACVVAWIGSL